MLKLLGLVLQVKNTEHSVIVTIETVGNAVSKEHQTGNSKLGAEFNITKGHVDVLLDDGCKAIAARTGIKAYYVGGCKFIFSRYLIDNDVALSFVNDAFTTSVDEMSKIYMKGN